MNTRVLLGAVSALFVGVIGYAYFTVPQTITIAPPIVTSTTPQTPVQTPPVRPSTLPPSSPYTFANVAKHNSASSCWTVINGNVYDLTNWITQHPGGAENILSICGMDGSTAFNSQHGGQRRPEQELANFYLAPVSP